MLNKFVLSALFFIAVGYFSDVYAQYSQGRFWYFGVYAGVRFDSGGPVALSDGQMNTTEGCTVVSSTNGELLFYSDGITVWNKNHQPMPNGFGLYGDPSSTQSGVAVPKPGAPGRFLLFTLAAEEYIPNGMCYSEIDMNLNGGLGDVLTQTKNTSLNPNCTEKFTVTSKADNSGFWVLAHNRLGNVFYTYEVTAGGVNPNPVVSALGETFGNDTHARGYMKFSSDGKWIAAAYRKASTAQLFKFDATTGAVTENVFLDTYPNLTGTIWPYGVEFSPDNKLLYVSVGGNSTGVKIFQYNLTAGNGDAILGTRTQVGTFTVSGINLFGGLQLGPDGKIYASREQLQWLGVIKEPNILGVGCNFQQNGLQLASGTTCRLGLPNFNQSVFNTCANSALRFQSVFNKSATCGNCLNGKIAAVAAGGTAPYTYSINGGPFQSSGIFNNLPHGVYKITVKDAQGCEIKRILKL